MKIKIFLSILILMFCSNALSERLLTVENGLSSSLVNGIFQSRNGFVWVLTDDGLNRLDGAKIKVYKNDPHNPLTLSDNLVKTIFETRDGRLLVGMHKGLQLIDQDKDQFRTIDMYLLDGKRVCAAVSSIVELRDGRVMVGTNGHGLFELTDSAGVAEAHQLKLENVSYAINSIFEDSKRNLWIATEDNGVYRIDAQWRVANYGAAIPMCFHESADGRILVGTLRSGLMVYDADYDRLEVIEDTRRMVVMSLCGADGDRVFVGTDRQGVKLLDTRTGTIADCNFDITSFNQQKAKVHTVIRDRAGNLWVGFYQKGVAIVPAQPAGFKYIGCRSSQYNIIGTNCVSALCDDEAGRTWVGTDNDGIYCIEPDGRSVHYPPSPGRIPDVVMSMMNDSRNRLWVGSYLSGMMEFDYKSGTCIKIDLYDRNGEAAKHIYDFAEDAAGNIWVATMGSGLFCFDPRTRTSTPMPMAKSGLDYTLDMNVLCNRWVNCLLYTPDNRLYFGTFDGLGCLDIGKRSFLEAFGRNRVLDGDVVSALHRDGNGDIWAGCQNGIFVLDSTGVKRSYTIDNGLPSNRICSIEADPATGDLWISTNHGLCRFDRASDTFVSYHLQDGIQGYEFSQGSSFVTRRGELFFGGMNGITHFVPADIRSTANVPTVEVVDFYIQGQPIRPGDKSEQFVITEQSVQQSAEFNLASTDNTFSIEFSSFDYINYERTTFCVSINGDTEMTLGNGVFRASYSNLKPGRYDFSVRACVGDTFSAPKTFVVVVHPPWYASVTAQIVYFLIIILIGSVVMALVRQRYQVRQLMIEHRHAEEINEAKLQFFVNIAHEIRTPMTLIISPLQRLLATDSNPERRKYYSTINHNANRLLQLVNQLMDIRKIDKGQMKLRFCPTDLVALLTEICTDFEYQAEAKQIELSYEHAEDKTIVWIDPANFDKIVFNLLSNAFKFTPRGGRICLRLSTEAGHAVISVSDNGVGIPADKTELIFERFYQLNQNDAGIVGSGIGLHLTRQLVEQHHGSIRATNNDGGGSLFVVRIPLGNAHLQPSELADEEPEAEDVEVAEVTPQTPVAEADDDATPVPEPKARKRFTIVFAEDDEEIRNYVCAELGSEFAVRDFENGKDAYAAVLKKAPDLIISDIMMPEMDGLELCRKIKHNVNVNHVPVVLLTAKTSEADNISGLSIGADAYIKKPFSIEVLRTTVSNLIRNREALRNNFSGRQTQDDKMAKLGVKSPDDRLMERIMNVINSHLADENLNVAFIAQEVGISRVHLHRKLKELTNQSTRDFIRNTRLRQAAKLLAEKRHNISEISELTGFCSTTYFATVFRELYGMTPTEYMEREHGRQQ